LAGESKMTLPLAINVSTFESPTACCDEDGLHGIMDR
jgi:hypothetical protein